jgi:hypothetical protein
VGKLAGEFKALDHTITQQRPSRNSVRAGSA